MTASLNGPASGLDEAIRALDRVLNESRAQWDDDARRSFDRRHGDRIVADGTKAVREMRQLVQELTAAMKTLESLN